ARRYRLQEPWQLCGAGRMRQGGGRSGATSSALVDECRDQGRGAGKNLPGASEQDPGGLTRRERNVEALERPVKPVAERLDEGLLACPATENPGGLSRRSRAR